MRPLHLRTLEATEPSPGAVRAGATRLVLRATRERADASSFVGRRAAAAVAQLAEGPERRQLTRVLSCGEGSDPATANARRVEALLTWAGLLEGEGRIEDAAGAVDVALALTPHDPALFLHAARLARKADDDARARILYDLVAHLDGGDGRLSRLADIGRALVSAEPERRLGRALRRARRAHDEEAAAVALEARAHIRRRRGELGGAVRDYLISAARYADPVDLGRIGHELADLLISAGDPRAARLVLRETVRHARERQALWARARLLVLARTMDDEVGQRRWADAPTPPLTSLAPGRSAGLDPEASREARLGRWIRRMGGHG